MTETAALVLPVRKTLIVAAWADELIVKPAVANWTLTAFDKIAAENGELSPAVSPGSMVLKLVAVAVMNELEATALVRLAANVAEPFEFVVTIVEPRKVWPS